MDTNDIELVAKSGKQKSGPQVAPDVVRDEGKGETEVKPLHGRQEKGQGAEMGPNFSQTADVERTSRRAVARASNAVETVAQSFMRAANGSTITRARSVGGTHILTSGEPRWWILEPKHPLKRFWDPLMGLIVIYIAIVIPFRVGFDSPATDNGWVQFETTLDVLFIVDVLLQFISAYENGEGVLILEPKKICIHYIRTWLAIDLVASIPFDAFLSPSANNDVNRLSKVARVAKLARSLRLLRLFKLLRISRASRLINRIEVAMQCNLATTRLFKTLLLVLTMGHVLSCMWHFTVIVAEDNDINPQDTWVEQYGVARASVTTRYISSAYFVYVTLSTVGYGDTHAVNDIEKTFSIAICLIGGIWYAAMLSSMTQLMRSFDRRTTMKRQRMEQLDRFVRDYRIQPQMRKRLREHFEVSLSIARPTSGYDVERLLKSLDAGLRVDILCWIHRHMISAIPYLGKQKDRVFAAEFARHLYPVTAGAGYQIQRAGAHALDMYFIKAGTVELEVPESSAELEEVGPGGGGSGPRRRLTMLEDLADSDEEAILASIPLSAGEYFGEVGCLLTNTTFASAFALEKSELFGISKVNLWKVLCDFPVQEARMLAHARKRHRIVGPLPSGEAQRRPRKGGSIASPDLPGRWVRGRVPKSPPRASMGQEPGHGHTVGKSRPASAVTTDDASEVENQDGEGDAAHSTRDGESADSNRSRSRDAAAPLSNLVIALTGAKPAGSRGASPALLEDTSGDRDKQAPIDRLRKAVKSGAFGKGGPKPTPSLPSPAILQLRLFNSLERHISETRAQLLDGHDALQKQIADIASQLKHIQGALDDMASSSL